MKKIALLVSILFLSSGCATIINGETQSILIKSVPPNAEGFTEGVQFQTPATVTLKRSCDHTVVFTKDGFMETSVKIESRFAWKWLLLSPLCNPIFGPIIDWVDGGGAYYLPAEVVVALVPISKAAEETTHR